MSFFDSTSFPQKLFFSASSDSLPSHSTVNGSSSTLRSDESLNSPTLRSSENVKSLDKITDKNGIIRFDFQFSYWIVIWFIFYYIISLQRERSPLTQQIYKYGNPIVSFIIALTENIIVFIILLFYNPPISLVIKYLFMMLVIKIIPLYLLYTILPKNIILDSAIPPPKMLTFWKNSFISFLVMFSLYNLYLFWNNTNIIDVYTKTIYFVFTNKNKTFFFNLINGLLEAN